MSNGTRYDLQQALRIGNRASNQDRVAVLSEADSLMMVLADGMGGHALGDVAAQTLVDTVTGEFRDRPKPITGPRQFLADAVSRAHDAMLEAGKRADPPVTPRTTCVICLIQQGCAWWAHAGDSRLYLVRNRTIRHRTRDHSYVEELYNQGRISRKQALSHPMRNYVTRCIGGTEEHPVMEYGTAEVLQPGDIILLCSDGLWNAIDDDSLPERLSADNFAQAVDTLAYEAEQLSYPNSDNIAVIGMRWQGEAADEVATRKSDVPAPVPSDHKDLTSAIDEIERAIHEFGDEIDTDNR